MGDLGQATNGPKRGNRKIADIRDARQWRDKTAETTDWVIANVPWTVAVSEWPGFNDRWPLLSVADLASVEAELLRRGEALEHRDADVDAIAAALTGRPGIWTAAADWLTANPGADKTDADFFRLFGQISRAELILAAIEHKRRLLHRS